MCFDVGSGSWFEPGVGTAVPAINTAPATDIPCKGSARGLQCTCVGGTWKNCATPQYPKFAGEIQLSHSISDIGDFITISGNNFTPHKNELWVYHDYVSGEQKVRLGSSLIDYAGNFSTTVRIPLFVKQGTNNTIVTSGERDLLSEPIQQSHTIKLSAIKVTPTIVTQGDELTIRGTSLPKNVLVQKITIGNVSVMNSPTPKTNDNGELTTVVQVPRRMEGEVLVVVKLNGISHYASIKIQ